MSKFFEVLVGLFLFTSIASAQPVRVSSDSDGQGFMFKNSSVCWVVMPRHLLDQNNQIEIETSPAPSQRGFGRAFPEFWPGMDFAIGSVGQSAGTAACQESLDTLTQKVIASGSSASGELRVVEAGGAVTAKPMTILDQTNHRLFVAEFTNPNDRAFQGLSGAFLFSRDRPIGMAIQTPDLARQMTFIRIEEMAFATTRWLDGRARAVQPARQAIQAQELDSLPLTLLDYKTPPTNPGFSPVNLTEGTGPYEFEFTGPTALTFGFPDDVTIGVSRARIISPEDHAKPLSMRVMSDSSPSQNNPVRLGRGDMTPDGIFDTGARRERFARSVTILIDSVQGEGPVRIDRVEIY